MPRRYIRWLQRRAFEGRLVDGDLGGDLREAALHGLEGLEAGRRPELREAAQNWCDAEQRALAGALEDLGSSDPAADASLVVAAIDGLGERVLAREEDPAKAAKEFRPELRRLIERLLG